MSSYPGAPIPSLMAAESQGKRWNNELERLIAVEGCEAVRGWYLGDQLLKRGPRRGEHPILTPPQADAMVKVLQRRPTAKPQSIAAYARDMAAILRVLGDPARATPRDVERVLRSTLVARKRVALLRALLKEAGRGDLVPGHLNLREKRKLRPDQMLNLEDINAMVRAALSLRDRALVAVLWETGGRIHEILALRLGDVYQSKGNGEAYLEVFLHKTKVEGEEHSCLLIEATPLLQAWIDAYPFEKTKEAPLFASSDGRRYGEAISYSGAYFLLKEISRRAGVRRPVNPHNFKHSRVTHLLRLGLSDSVIKKLVGWSPSSNMLAHYGHLVSEDAQNALLRAHGKAPLEVQRAGGLVQPEGELVPAIPLVDNRPRPTGAPVDLVAANAKTLLLAALDDPGVAAKLKAYLEKPRDASHGAIQGH